MRTRTRLLWTFLLVHVGISLAVGFGAWFGLRTYLRHQAEASAADLAQVLAAGGFTMTADIRRKLETLTGYEFELLDRPGPDEPGTVQVPLGEGREVVRIDYRTPGYRTAQNVVLVGTVALLGLGVLVIGLLSWWTAAGLAGPLERLAAAAREIGAGNFDRPVSPVGSGEVADLAADLESMRRHLVDITDQLRRTERLKALGLFTATVAHEVRNPLSAIGLSAQLLARRLPGEPAIGLIENEIERLDLIVDELVSYSDGMRIEPGPCDLADVAGNAVRLLAHQAEHAGVTVEVEGAARVVADAGRLRQLLLNLLLNAIQASHGGGEVTVRIDAGSLAVIDRGRGVDAALRDRLFEPFASARRGGTGLGLHLAQAIAKAHGAEITYEPGEPGSVFRLVGLRPA